MALLKNILPAFFVIFAFGEILRIRLPNAITFGVVDLFLALILLIWLFTIKKTKYFLRDVILIFLGASIFALVINIPNFLPKQILVSSMYLVRFALYASMYFVFVDIGKKYKNYIPKYMLMTGAIFIIFGFIQYLFFSNHKYLYDFGWDMHQFRLFSTFFDPNFAGAFLVLVLVFVFVLRDKLLPQKWKLITYSLILLNFIAIILTYSRGSYLMLLACVVAYSAFTKKWKLTLGLIFSFVLIFLVLSPKFNLESTNLLRFASVEARIDSSRLALNIWQKNPLGVGFDTYRYAREKYGNIDNSTYGPSHAGAGVDNSFILVLVTTGVVGLVCYLFLIYKMLKLGLLHVKENRYALILVISLVGIIVNALTINSLFYSFIMLWIFILAGFTESSLRE